jgi:hypothetical protein
MADELDAFMAEVERTAAALPPAPGTAGLPEMSQRARDQRARVCVRCGTHAGWAAIAATGEGPRWLDLCWGCGAWLTHEATDRINREIKEIMG